MQVTDDLESAIRSTKVVPAGWEDVLAPHLRACLAWAQAGSANVTGAGAGSSTSALKPTGKLLEAFSHQNDALIALNPRLGDHDARIVRPLLRMVSDAGALSRGSEQEAVTTGAWLAVRMFMVLMAVGGWRDVVSSFGDWDD